MTDALNDVRSVRPSEQLDWAKLVEWLREHLTTHQIPRLDLTATFEVSQFPGGHSNLTYLIRFAGGDIVVRRPPLGPVPPTAHDMAREFRWLSAMHRVFPLAPQPYALCEDTSVIGSVFYAMERRRGVVIRAEEPPAVMNNPVARRAVSAAAVDTLADLHAIDVAANGLSGLGKPAGFVERQVRGWSERWQRSQTTNVPHMDALAAWLRAHLPGDPASPSVVHGDFKLDNVMLDPQDVGRIVAVLDWEMSALGDALVDLGIFLALTTVTHREGYFTRDEILERYAARSGRDLSGIRFYQVFAIFKIAVVIQQIYFRYVNGQTTDARFAKFNERVAYLATQATALAEQ